MHLMDLKEFVSTIMHDIAHGVADANVHLKELGAHAGPAKAVKFDVAVTVVRKQVVIASGADSGAGRIQFDLEVPTGDVAKHTGETRPAL